MERERQRKREGERKGERGKKKREADSICRVNCEESETDGLISS